MFLFCLILKLKKKICSPLLRVTTNHLYTFSFFLGKCRFTWRLMILCACSDFSSSVPLFFSAGELFLFSLLWKCLWEIIDFFILGEFLLVSQNLILVLWKWTLGALSRLLDIHREKKKREIVGVCFVVFFCSSVPNMVFRKCTLMLFKIFCFPC